LNSKREKRNQLNILTDYEFGSLVSAIEWVGRGSKPVAEVCSQKLPPAKICDLKRDIRLALLLANEPNISGYILYRKNGWCEYGVYRFSWVMEALLFISRKNSAPWLQGLVFGYSPDAIERYCQEHGAIQSPFDTSSTLEIVHARKAGSLIHNGNTRKRPFHR